MKLVISTPVYTVTSFLGPNFIIRITPPLPPQTCWDHVPSFESNTKLYAYINRHDANCNFVHFNIQVLKTGQGKTKGFELNNKSDFTMNIILVRYCRSHRLFIYLIFISLRCRQLKLYHSTVGPLAKSIWKGCEKQSWFNLALNPSVYLKGLSKPTKNLCHDGQCSGWDWNPGSPKHEAGVLPTRWRHQSVSYYQQLAR
jgi:hypothetical protein